MTWIIQELHNRFNFNIKYNFFTLLKDEKLHFNSFTHPFYLQLGYWQWNDLQEDVKRKRYQRPRIASALGNKCGSIWCYLAAYYRVVPMASAKGFTCAAAACEPSDLFSFFKHILLIMLLQLSDFFLPFIPFCPVPPTHHHPPTVVHIHGSCI